MTGQFSRRRMLQLTALPALAVGPFTPATAQSAASTPGPVAFPVDDGPHAGALTEWWYYTGHLWTEDGARFGFEEVFFKARRGGLSGWAAHVAITDATAGRFVYDQRRVLGDGGVAGASEPIDFAIDDWAMTGSHGQAKLAGSVDAMAFTLALASEKPPVLHGDDGFTRDAATGAGSFYYSRTRIAAAGTLSIGGADEPVTGIAWMDHQWGDFTTFSENGWDWFAIQLDDDTELMLYYLRDAAGAPSLIAGTFVEPDGSAVETGADAVTVTSTSDWTSPESGATYPSGWTIRVPGRELALRLTPVLADQELDTRETTGVTYWEGDVTVDGTKSGVAITGVGYVELTGYAKARDGAAP